MSIDPYAGIGPKNILTALGIDIRKRSHHALDHAMTKCVRVGSTVPPNSLPYP